MLMCLIIYLHILGVERPFIHMPIMLITYTKVTVFCEFFHASVSIIRMHEYGSTNKFEKVSTFNC
jgi:hypothetical protein